MMVVLLLATCLTTYALARRLFGPPAGLLALTLAALSPSMLAHGRLVTTDIPITLCMALTLLSFARLLERRTWLRLLLAGLAVAAAAVTKMSWPLVIPALVAMAMVNVVRGVRRAPASKATPRKTRWGDWTPVALLVVLAGAAWLGIWTCYRWRSFIFPRPTAELNTPENRARLDHTGRVLGEDWQRALYQADNTPRPGLLPALIIWAADEQLLPDAYLLGLAQTFRSTHEREGYLMGEYSATGWRSYFPIAFAIKTPVATMTLVLAGLVALVCRRTQLRDATLGLGLATFAAVYSAYVIFSSFNIGERHLLPVYPALFVLGGAAAAWLTGRIGRALIGGALVWLAGANLWIYPQYLAYFNELIGGPSRGHLYLTDSNIDWGQDLLRLADYARRHPAAALKLAYFGSVDPNYYVRCSLLPGQHFGPVAELNAGTYVVSLTELSGVYESGVRDAFWTDRARAAYAEMAHAAGAAEKPDEAAELRQRHRQAAAEYPAWRAHRLLNRLRRRPPDERVGYSLLVYHLTDADVEELTQP
jgi:hypothetical protein